ncbi:MAG TPA: prepilin-type N-terminal cleavage/methylation domain-containing protein [Thermomonas sp.]|jgi:type IV pilus assembly protein PilW|uniref:PilW family protein n=1 Tax=Thermomonas sp. TaxID=1971895 RepID=UPI002BAB4F1F|nr:prepilin-type N-terminal cleavage/methylation domain-containing protein [Thermomonas sp.]HOV97338.1 prepilin-type N-terminal cleavage/methylation domain-containing protein [Thermomonas sp.]
MSHKSQPLQRRSQGFTLVELMIAMVLGLLVLGAALAVFQSNQRTFSSNEGQNRVQENARIAYEMMGRDIRSVGSSACSSEAMVLGSDSNSTAFRAPLNNDGTGMSVTSADDLSYRVASGTGSTTSVTLLESTPSASDIFKAGDVVMVCNAAMTGFATVGSVAGQKINFSAALPFDPSDTANASPGSISIARFRTNRWYVATNGRGSGNSLWVARSGGAGQEVADGVQSATLAFHQASGGTPTTYVASPTNFQYVDAVRFTLPIRAVSELKSGENRNINRNLAATVSIRNRGL